MEGQVFWLVTIVLIVVALAIGFFVGRGQAGSAKQKNSELEAEVERHKAELAAYRREVDTHFDETTSLFVSMAGSYKALFEHLNSGYEKLADGERRHVFRERIATLLMDGRQEPVVSSMLEHEDGAAPAATPSVAAGQGLEPDAAAQAAPAAQPQAAGVDGEAAETAAPRVKAAHVPAAEQDAVMAAAALGAVAPESADGDAAAVRDASGVPVPSVPSVAGQSKGADTAQGGKGPGVSR